MRLTANQKTLECDVLASEIILVVGVSPSLDTQQLGLVLFAYMYKIITQCQVTVQYSAGLVVNIVVGMGELPWDC